MEYDVEVSIKASREKVVRLFQDPDGIKEWQPSFIGMKILEGEPGQDGSQVLMMYKNKKREMEIKETIIENRLPEYFISTYDAAGVHNIVKSIFTEIDDNTTLYRSENEFQLNSILMKIFGFFMPSAFKKQTKQYLDYFKAYVERTN